MGKPMDGVDPPALAWVWQSLLRGQQNTFRANVLRSGFLGSEDCQFSAGVSYLYDDFLERGTWGADPTRWMRTPRNGHEQSTCRVPFWRQPGRGTREERLWRVCGLTNTTCGARL